MKKSVILLIALLLTMYGNLCYSLVPDQYVPQEFACNGSTTEFNFTFQVFEVGDLAVYLRNTTTGDITLWSQGSEYTPSATNNDYSSGGTITAATAPASGNILVATRTTTLTQEGRFRQNTALENTLDRQTLSMQEVQYGALNRGVRFPEGDGIGLSGELPNAEDRKGNFLYFSSTTGEPTMSSGGIIGSAMTVSGFMEGLLGDATALAAMATLHGIPVENVRGYGAICDGVADDTTAVQAAITALENSGGLVIIDGICKISSTLTFTGVSSMHLYIVGTGKGVLGVSGNSGFLWAGAEDGTMFASITDQNKAALHFRNLRFHGIAASRPAYAIHWKTVTRSEIVNCQFVQVKTGIYWQGVILSRIEFCWFEGCYTDAISFKAGGSISALHANWIQYNEFSYNGQYAIDFQGCDATGCVVSNNSFEGSVASTLHTINIIGGLADSLISGNRFEDGGGILDPDKRSLNIMGALGITIEGNSFGRGYTSRDYHIDIGRNGVVPSNSIRLIGNNFVNAQVADVNVSLVTHGNIWSIGDNTTGTLAGGTGAAFINFIAGEGGAAGAEILCQSSTLGLSFPRGGVSDNQNMTGYPALQLNDKWFSAHTAAPLIGTAERGNFFFNKNAAAGANAGWVCITAGSPGTWVPFGGIQTASAYTTSNVTADREIDADSTSTAEIADVLCTLIEDMKTQGLLKSP